MHGVNVQLPKNTHCLATVLEGAQCSQQKHTSQAREKYRNNKQVTKCFNKQKFLSTLTKTSPCTPDSAMPLTQKL